MCNVSCHFLCHAGHAGMRWGYNDGKENGKRTASNDIRWDSSGNKYKQLENGSVVFIDSRRRNSISRRPAIGQRRRSLPVGAVASYGKISISKINSARVSSGRSAINRLLKL